MLYRATGIIIPPKPRKKRRFIIEIVQHPSGQGFEILTTMWWGHEKYPSKGYMYCKNMLDAIHYLKIPLIGRNRKSKIVVKRQTKGHHYL